MKKKKKAPVETTQEDFLENFTPILESIAEGWDENNLAIVECLENGTPVCILVRKDPEKGLQPLAKLLSRKDLVNIQPPNGFSGNSKNYIH